MSGDELVIYELAFHLKLPLYELLHKMPYDEFLGWMLYLKDRPVDWRDDDRTMKLLQAQGCKEKPETIFSSLAAIKSSKVAVDDRTISEQNLKGSFMYQKMISSKGGDRLDL